MTDYGLNIFKYQIKENNNKLNDNIYYLFFFFIFLNNFYDTIMVNFFFNIIF